MNSYLESLTFEDEDRLFDYIDSFFNWDSVPVPEVPSCFGCS